ncbi:MAG: hypothetical protein GMKNLPBB_00132 [Myxococcota bacterium]|nr:hypothetical protein [Myxococcota bacterium]
MIRWMLSAILFGLMGLSASSCVIPVGDIRGALTVTWEIPGGCAANGIDLVRLRLIDWDANLVQDQFIQCSAGGTVLSPQLGGPYTLEIFGLAPDNVAEYFSSITVVVEDGDIAVGPVRLNPIAFAPGKEPPGEVSASLGDVSFTWRFEGDANCVRAGVDTVYFAIRDVQGKLEFDRRELCSIGGGTVTRFREGIYLVYLQGLDDRGRIIYDGEYEVRVVGGRVNQFDFDLPRAR